MRYSRASHPGHNTRMPLRIALISHSPGGGGAERALARLASALDPKLWQQLVVVPAPGPLADELRAQDLDVRVLPIAWWIPATHWPPEHFFAQYDGLEERVARLVTLLADERVDLVHSNTVVTLEGALAAAQLGLPHIWHSRGQFDDRFPPPYFEVDLAFIFSALDLLSDALLCVSKAVAEQAHDYCREVPVEIVPEALDLDDLVRRSTTVSRSTLLERLHLPSDARIVACLGGLQRRKGQLDLVLAAVRIAARYPKAFFVLAGAANDTEYVETLRSSLAELGLATRFRLPGHLDTPPLLAHCDLIVHPSHSEGFSLSILEALALGRPVVATRCGGSDEVIEEWRTGLLVPPRQPEAIAAAIEAVLSGRLAFDPDRARERTRIYGPAASAAAIGASLLRAHRHHADSRPEASRRASARSFVASLGARFRHLRALLC